MDVFALIGTAIELTNRLRGIAEQVNDADAKLAIADLKCALADIKSEVAALKDENLTLRTNLAKATSKTSDAAKFIFADNVLF